MNFDTVITALAVGPCAARVEGGLRHFNEHHYQNDDLSMVVNKYTIPIMCSVLSDTTLIDTPVEILADETFYFVDTHVRGQLKEFDADGGYILHLPDQYFDRTEPIEKIPEIYLASLATTLKKFLLTGSAEN